MVAAYSTSRLPVPAQAISAFCQKWKVRELSLFGSVLRHDFSPDSDVDVMVELAPDSTVSLFEWVDMKAELEVLFGRPVDMLEKTSLRNPFRKQTVMGTRQVMYAA